MRSTKGEDLDKNVKERDRQRKRKKERRDLKKEIESMLLTRQAGNVRAMISVTSKKSPNVNKSCQKMISLAKLKILTPSQKLSEYVGDLGKLIVAKGFKKFPKVQ